MKLSLILFASLLLFALEASANWTKECKKYAYGGSSGKDIFVGNPANIYPHIHCGKDFIVFSHSKNSHTDLVRGQPMCGNLNKAATTLEWYNNMKEADNAKGLINELKADYCKKMSMMKRLLMRLLLEN